MSLKGAFSAPGDKSMSHRIALVSILARGETRVSNIAPGEDVRSSLNAVKLLGSGVRDDRDTIVVTGAEGVISKRATVDCGNSGTTMRLLMGILAGRKGEFILDGDDSLRRRPMERVAAPLRSMGAHVTCQEGRCPVRIGGGALVGFEYKLPVASAQLKSAVLFAGIQAEGDTRVIEPVPSRDHTERLLALLGADISAAGNSILVRKSSLALPESFRVPGDASSAAFFICAACIMPGSDVTAENVLLNPTRTGFLNVLRRMGAQVEIVPQGNEPEPWGTVRARFSPDLIACRISAEEIPSLVDEVPILALVATRAEGTTVFDGVGELRVKESDRLAAVAEQLGLMSARLRIEGDSLLVDGPAELKAPPELRSFGDHRIAMMLRLAGLAAGAEPAIEGEDSTSISYPGFHDTLKGLLK